MSLTFHHYHKDASKYLDLCHLFQIVHKDFHSLSGTLNYVQPGRTRNTQRMLLLKEFFTYSNSLYYSKDYTHMEYITIRAT